jgi:hypothetical protein
MRRITLALSVLFLGYAGAAFADPVRLTSAAMVGGDTDAQFIQGTFDESSSAAPRSPDVDVPSVALFDDDVRNLTGDDDDSPAMGAMPPTGDKDADSGGGKKKGDNDSDNDSGGGSKSKPGDNDGGGTTGGGTTGGGTTGGGTGGGTTGGGTGGGTTGGGTGGSPTPEPASMLLLGTGLAAAWQSRRLRRDR